MKIVAPVEIGFGDLISSNIAEELPRATGTTTYTAWSATTTYSAGTQVCWIFTVDRNFYTLSGTGPGGGASSGNYFALWTAKASNLLNREPGKTGTTEVHGTLPGYNVWTLGSYAPAWNADSIYPANTIVGWISGGVGAFYQSLAAGNLNNDPASATAWWRKVELVPSYNTWNSGTTYGAGELVCILAGQAGSVYRSLQAGNLNKPPETETSWWTFLGDTWKEWASGTTYAVGDTVVDLTTHHAYESVQASNTGHDPASDDGTWWLDLGATNRWAMFDNSNSSQTAYGEEIDVTFAPTELVDTLALLNMQASKAWISAQAPQDTARNLIASYTEDFTNAAWSKTSCTVTADQATDPTGSTGMDLLDATSVGGMVSRTVTFTGDGTKALSLFVRAGSAAASAIVLRDTTASADRLNAALAWSGGTPTVTCSAGAVQVDPIDKGNGVWELRLAAGGVVAANTNSLRILPAGASGTGTMHAWGTQAENASSSTAYQPATSAWTGYDMVYCQYFNMADNSFVTNWRRYFFDPLRYKSDLLVQDLPSYLGTQIRAKVSLAGGTAKVGAVVCGWAEEIGATLRGVKNGIRDYSRKEFDQFGNAQFVERGFAKTADLQVWVDNANYDAAYNALAARRAQPTLFIGSGDYAGLWILGIPRDFSAGIPQFQTPMFDIQIEGLT